MKFQTLVMMLEFCKLYHEFKYCRQNEHVVANSGTFDKRSLCNELKQIMYGCIKHVRVQVRVDLHVVVHVYINMYMDEYMCMS